MKLILSRKAFDSGPTSGRAPSPILPNGTLCPLPIPEPAAANENARPYAEITIAGQQLGPLVKDLTGGKIGPADHAHLDPDLDPGSVPRAPGWKPLFGQAAAAEGHLRNQGVGPGDLFLFFGWFRDVEWDEAGGYRYVSDSRDRHVLFGWLQVERRISLGERADLPVWALDHPHAKQEPYATNDALYLSIDELHLGGQALGVPGGGMFPRYDDRLCLTGDDPRRSIWSLPRWFHPHGRESCLSYHGRAARWSHSAGRTRLQSVGRGQEFVLDCAHYPEAVSWAKALLAG